MAIASSLDPSTWSHLPDDIVFIIIETSDRTTQIHWSATCRKFYEFCYPRIWNELHISSLDFDGYFGAMTLPNYPGNNGNIHYMKTALACRGECFGSHVRRLNIDTRALRKDGRVLQQAQQRCVEQAMPVLFAHLPKLASCTFDGPLYQATLKQIVQIPNLEQLELRTCGWYTERGGSYSEEIHEWVWKDPSDLYTYLGIIENLVNLQVLKIGRLMPVEAEHLAAAIGALPLIHLQLSAGSSAGPWVYRSVLDDSSLHMFFLYMWTHKNDADPPRLPSTLETLTLMDYVSRYPCVIPTRQLRYAIEACPHLQEVEASLESNRDIFNFLKSFESQPAQPLYESLPANVLKKHFSGGFTKHPIAGPFGALWSYEYVDDLLDSLSGYDPLIHANSRSSAGIIAEKNEGWDRLRPIRFEKVDIESVE